MCTGMVFKYLFILDSGCVVHYITIDNICAFCKCGAQMFLIVTDINECLEDPCDNNATCNNTDGSFLCTCNTGYSGDGESCTGM